MTADDILDLARRQIGVTEKPAGSNHVLYNNAYYGREVSGSAYPWCMAFIWWLFYTKQAMQLLHECKTASTNTMANVFRRHNQWVTSGYRPGDLVFFDWTGNQRSIVHVGIVESVNANGNLVTIEGNTSLGNDSNGGSVMRRIRAQKFVVGAGRPAYEEEDEMKYYKTINDVPASYKPSVQKAMNLGGLRGTGAGEINVSEDLCRTLTILDRMGVLDKGD